MIEINDFSINFSEQMVLSDINITIPKDKFTVILGHSGSGKSVLIKSLIGLFTHFQGNISIDNKVVNYNSRKEIFTLRKRVGMLFQSGALFDSMDVFQNIAFPLYEHTKLPDAAIESKVSELLLKVDLPGIDTRFPSELSGGMQRRVALARAIALQPEYLVYDEPTTGLDPITTKEIIKLIAALHGKEIKSTCVITHDFASFEPLCEHLIVLNKGKCLLSSSYHKKIQFSDEIKNLMNISFK